MEAKGLSKEIYFLNPNWQLLVFLYIKTANDINTNSGAVICHILCNKT